MSDHLERSQSVCAALAGFLSNFISRKEYQEKFAGSFSGHIIKLQFNATVTEAVMLISRLWDKGNGAYTIFSLLEVAARSCRNSNDFSQGEARSAVLERINGSALVIQNSKEFSILRAYRSDYLAHALPEGSRDRQKHIEIFDVYERPKYKDVIALLDQTAEIISDIRFLVFEVRDDPKTLRQFYSDYADAYWGALPKFSEVEDLPQN